MYENIAFSGGSNRGYCYLGVLRAFEKHKELLKNIKNISGSSIGSFFAVIFNMGFTNEELVSFLNINIEITDIDIETFFEKYGFSSGMDIIVLFRDIISKKYNPDITFEELYKNTGKNLYIGISSLSKCEVEYLSHFNHPKLRIIDAIRISISLPFIFTAVKMNNSLYIDGALFERLPLKVFDLNKKTLGINLADSFDKLEKILPKEITCIEEYTMNILLFCKKMINRDERLDKIDIINIETKDINPVNFSLPMKTKIKMVGDGYLHTMRFLNNIINKK